MMEDDVVDFDVATDESKAALSCTRLPRCTEDPCGYRTLLICPVICAYTLCTLH